MTIELEKTKKTTEEQLRDEHIASMDARKVVNAFKLNMVWDEDNSRSLAPISHTLAGATAVEVINLDGSKEYLAISNVGIHLREAAAGDADATDFYIPPNTYFIYKMRSEEDRLSIYSATAGFVQFNELRKD